MRVSNLPWELPGQQQEIWAKINMPVASLTKSTHYAIKLNNLHSLMHENDNYMTCMHTAQFGHIYNKIPLQFTETSWDADNDAIHLLKLWQQKH